MASDTTVETFTKKREEFQGLLDAAECAASSAWEIDFVSDMTAKFDRYGMTMFLSERQHSQLVKLSER